MPSWRYPDLHDGAEDSEDCWQLLLSGRASRGSLWSTEIVGVLLMLMSLAEMIFVQAAWLVGVSNCSSGLGFLDGRRLAGLGVCILHVRIDASAR